MRTNWAELREISHSVIAIWAPALGLMGAAINTVRLISLETFSKIQQLILVSGWISASFSLGMMLFLVTRVDSYNIDREWKFHVIVSPVSVAGTISIVLATIHFYY